MAITLPRAMKSAAYRSRSTSGYCALTRSSSAGNFLAFGEVVTPPLQRSVGAALIGATLPYPLNPRNKSLRMNQFPLALSRTASNQQLASHHKSLLPSTIMATVGSMARNARAANDSALLTSRDNRWLKEFRVALRGGLPTIDGFVGVEGVRLVEETLRS